MIKGLPKVVVLAMFVVLAVLALYVASASARPYGITGGNKECVRLPHHKHHNHRKCWKHHKHRHRKGHKHTVVIEKTVTKTVENGGVNTSPKVENIPTSEEKCIIEQTNPPIAVGDNCEGFDGGNSCQYLLQGCNEVIPFEVKNLEVYQNVGEYVPVSPPNIWASAEVTYPYMDSVTTVFYAEYGSFSKVYGGIVKPSILTPGRYSEYVPPCAEKMPSDGYDTAWVVVYDHTTKEFVESEHVKFNITEPENVHEVHPVG